MRPRQVVKFSLEQTTKTQKGSRDSRSTLPSTSSLGGGGWSKPRPGRTLPPGKSRYSLYRMLGGPQRRSGRVRKISAPHWASQAVLQFTSQGKNSGDLGSQTIGTSLPIHKPGVVWLRWSFASSYYFIFLFLFFFWPGSPPVGQGLLIHEVSRSPTTTNHSR